jgi:hypothetical protein
MLIKANRYVRNTIAGVVTCLLAGPAAATTLIATHEAQLPPDDESQVRSGIERGPDIVPLYPAANTGSIQSPFRFRVRFQPHGNTRIDLDSVVVTYMRIPAIDLTARLRPFIKTQGIDMPDAEVPLGAHRIFIFLRDSAGHENTAEVRFDVAK